MRTHVRLRWRAACLALAGSAALLLAGAGPALATTTCNCQLTPVIVVQPTTTQVGSAVMPPVKVAVEDSYGRVDWGYNGWVTLSYAVNPVGAAEPAGNVVRAIHGVATFRYLTFPSVGFGFELVASIPGATSRPSQPFDIVGQLVQCQPGQPCQSGTVTAGGTSGVARSGAAAGSSVLTATGGGFPRLSCTSAGGVLSFSSGRSEVITLSLAKSIAGHRWLWSFNVCWGAPEPFVTKSGHKSAFNPANGDFEGLLPNCNWHRAAPCVLSRHRTWSGAVVITVLAPAQDPHMTF